MWLCAVGLVVIMPVSYRVFGTEKLLCASSMLTEKKNTMKS